MNKIATISMLTAIVLILFASIFLIRGATSIYNSITSKNATEVCKNSIKLAANSKRLPSQDIGIGDSHFSLNCPRQELVIKKKQIVEDGTINQKKFHKIISDEMAKCWHMAGSGKLDPFSNWEKEGKTYCLICKSIVFEDSLNKFIQDNLPPITDSTPHDDYLMEQIKLYHPTDPQMFIKTQYFKEGVTYFEYLYGEPPILNEEELQQMDKLNAMPFYDGSSIIIRMYKGDTKSTSSRWGVKSSMMVAGVSTAVLQLPFADKFINKVGTSLRLAQVAGVAISGLGLRAAFDDCPSCQARGGILYISPYTRFSDKISMATTTSTNQQLESDVPICSIIVN